MSHCNMSDAARKVTVVCSRLQRPGADRRPGDNSVNVIYVENQVTDRPACEAISFVLMTILDFQYFSVAGQVKLFTRYKLNNAI
jgi:hypothetical protein